MKEILGIRGFLSVFFSQYAHIHKNWIIAVVSKFVLGVTLCSVALLVFQFSSLPNEIPLWYAMPWGEQRLAHSLWLFLLPTGSLAWYIITVCVAIFLLADYLIFAQLLFLTSLLTTLLSTMTLVKILFLVH